MGDPKMTKVDGRYVCAVCEAPLNATTVKNADPFCSVEHARTWHHTELPKPRRGVPVGASA